MEQLFARVADKACIAPEVAQNAVGAILAFIIKEVPPADAEELLATMPGAADLIAKSNAEEKSGLLGSLFGMMGGGLIGLAGRLTNLGLGMDAMQTISREVFDFAKEKAGSERIEQIAATIPGLRQLL
jgi:hypothetical protein